MKLVSVNEYQHACLRHPSDVPKDKRERIKTDGEDRGLGTNPGCPGNEGGQPN
jgi:hypothetical protein